MELTDFTRTLEGMSAIDIRVVAAGLDACTKSPADEVETWQAIIVVDRELRRCRRTREAAAASIRASRAVLLAAEHAEMELPDQDVTRVARAAADVARGLVVEGEIDPHVRGVIQLWASLFHGSCRPYPAGPHFRFVPAA